MSKEEQNIYNSCGHNLKAYKLGYLEHLAQIERRIKKGMKQNRCDKCGLWLFKDEISTNKKNIGVIPK